MATRVSDMETMTSTSSIFDPQLYRRVRQPTLAAEGLPPWCYTSQAFYDREVERIFRTEWNFVGRADEIAKPGDFKVFDLVGESVIVLRDQAGGLRAFANTCRHRGTRLLDGTGNCKSIACPYHAWVYALDGRLIASLGMEATLDFDAAEHGLLPVRLEEWDGFLFVSFADGETLADYLGDLPKRFRAERQAGFRHLLHRHLSLHLLRHDTGLHVVAAGIPARAWPHQGERRILLPARYGGTTRFCGEGAEILPALGHVAARGQCDIRAPAGRSRLAFRPARPALRA